MVEIKNTKVYDLYESILASGYPMMTEPLSNEDYSKALKEIESGNVDLNTHLKRVSKLSSTPIGSGHDNFLKGIRVSFDIKYPNYFTPELQRYKFIDIVSSSSKMHKLMKMDLDISFNKYVTQASKHQIQNLVSAYNNNPTYKNFMYVISNCPMGLELFMRCSTNYCSLKTIYSQRKNHKLKEDWGAFCKWIESLPYSKLITN